MENSNLRRADLCGCCVFVEKVPQLPLITSFLNQQVMMTAWMALAAVGTVAFFRKSPIGASLGVAAGGLLAIYTRVRCRASTTEDVARQERREAMRQQLSKRYEVGASSSRVVLRQLTALILKVLLASCAIYATYALTHWLVRKAPARVVRYGFAPLSSFFGGFIFLAKGIDMIATTRRECSNGNPSNRGLGDVQ